MGEIVERLRHLIKLRHLILEVTRAAKFFDQPCRAWMASRVKPTGSFFLAGSWKWPSTLRLFFAVSHHFLESRLSKICGATWRRSDQWLLSTVIAKDFANQ